MEERRPKKPLDHVRDTIYLKHDFLSTEKTSVQWARWFILIHKKRYPIVMRGSEIEQFPTYLATIKKDSGSTQIQTMIFSILRSLMRP